MPAAFLLLKPSDLLLDLCDSMLPCSVDAQCRTVVADEDAHPVDSQSAAPKSAPMVCTSRTCVTRLL